MYDDGQVFPFHNPDHTRTRTGLELLAAIVHAYGHLRRAPSIPVRGKHLDVLEVWDLAFIAFNKLATTVFSYHLLRYLWCSDAVRCLCVCT